MGGRAIAIALVRAVAAGPAAADVPAVDASTLAAAESHHRRGSMLFDLGDYTGAIEEFQAGFVLTKAPGFLYNLAQAYRLAGDCERAERAYRAYLEATPIANRALIETRIDEMAACRARRIDPPALPSPQVAAASAPAAPPPIAKPAPSSALRPIGWTALAIGAASAGVATWATLESRSAARHVEQVAATDATWTPADAAIEDHGHRMRTTAIVAWSTAAVAVVGGCTLLWLGRERREGPVLQAVATAQRA